MLRNLLKSAKPDFTRPVQSDTRPMDNAARLAEYKAKREISQGQELPRLKQAARRLDHELT